MNEKLLDKIKKLLALARSPNQHEAERALAAAQAMMLRHNIQLSQVESFDPDKQRYDEETVLSCGRRPPSEVPFVIPIVREFFFVRPLWQRRHRDGRATKDLSFFGTPENIETAKHVYRYLCAAFRALWKEYRQHENPLATQGDARLFYYGAQQGLTEKLKAEKEQAEAADPSAGTALVVLNNALVAALSAKYPALRKGRASSIRYRDTDAEDAGYYAGRQIQIRKGISEQGQERRLIK